MLYRVGSFFEYLNISFPAREEAEQLAARVAERANNMTTLQDYQALAGILLYANPKLIFEIGTYLGVTSDFFLELLPDCKVVSIGYINPILGLTGKRYNNSGLSKKEIGSLISPKNRSRFRQLLGNSHNLIQRDLVNEFGYFDLVFIDGDHSREGVHLDTELAKQIINYTGTICWHDANPKEAYLPVRRYLENELSLSALATTDNYIGGIACWSHNIERLLERSLMGEN